jgi:hypothetical protein
MYQRQIQYNTKGNHGNCNIGMCNFVRIEITLSTDLYPIRSTATDMCLGCSGQLYMLLSFSGNKSTSWNMKHW